MTVSTNRIVAFAFAAAKWMDIQMEEHPDWSDEQLVQYVMAHPPAFELPPSTPGNGWIVVTDFFVGKHDEPALANLILTLWHNRQDPNDSEADLCRAHPPDLQLSVEPGSKLTKPIGFHVRVSSLRDEVPKADLNCP